MFLEEVETLIICDKCSKSEEIKMKFVEVTRYFRDDETGGISNNVNYFYKGTFPAGWFWASDEVMCPDCRKDWLNYSGRTDESRT